MGRRRSVLVKPDATVVIQLRANPGTWYAVAAGDLSRRHTYSQTALRIRTGERKAFRSGVYETKVITNPSLPDPVELRVRFIPSADSELASPLVRPVELGETAS